MTLTEILRAVCERKKTSKQTLYVYLNELKIKPVGRRQRPQRYPEDSAEKVLEHLGVPHVASMAQLRHARRTARRTR